MWLEYIELAKESPAHSRGRTSVPCLRGHMFKGLFTAVAVRTDLRARLTKARTLEDMVRTADNASRARREHEEVLSYLIVSYRIVSNYMFV